MKNKFYITAAIPYVNANPHLGHALEFLQCDAIARKEKLLGNNTILLTGADENSIKNVQAAEKEGVTTKMLCDRNSEKFKELIKLLNTDFDIFQRSSSLNHIQGSQLLWTLCDKSNDIYKKGYEGLYCDGCEAFYTKDDLNENGLCPEHLVKPQNIKEENYFFRLSKYQKILEDLIEKDKIMILPKTRKNEVMSFIKSGLEDFSISRSKIRAKNWGVEVPNDPTQIMYVWFDALNVYQTGIGFGWNDENYNKYWPADIHVIGKGIIRFHAVYWPAILLSAGLEIPKNIFVHGYITIEGQKMSKALGNVIDPFLIAKEYGTDALRYYLLREIPSLSDGDFSINRFREIYNSDLANNLGNLISRVYRLFCKEGINIKYQHKDNFQEIYNDKKYSVYKNSFTDFKLNETLNYIIQLSTELNRKIDNTKPWTLKNKGLETALKNYLEDISIITTLLLPFLPNTSNRISRLFEEKTDSALLFPRLK